VEVGRRLIALYCRVEAFFPRYHRSVARPFFNKDRITDFELFDNHALETISVMKARLAEGYPVEFQVCQTVYSGFKLAFSGFP
jgi:hypothetical protein